MQDKVIIALVITIVILIILATVTINAVFGDSGLLQYAQDARNYQANADASDGELINDATSYIDGIIGGGSGGDTPTEPTVPSTVAEAKENGNTFKDTTTIKDDLDNDVTIPGGFHVSDDSETKVEEGIVIEDDVGNQFVWIPVGEYNVSTSISAEGKLTNNLSRRSWADEDVISEPTEVNGDDAIENYYGFSLCYGEGNENSVAKDQIEGFKNSVITNKGFYIGRYEQGTRNECKAGKEAYTDITRDEAKTQAEAMYRGNSYVTSELISSYAWDTALNFICQNNEEGYLLATTTDSTYGNRNTKQLTGAYEADNYCNIHDLLGNCAELTTEYFDNSETSCIVRGTYYSACRECINNYTIHPSYSFRVQLYIK